jgi:hypothetical protein
MLELKHHVEHSVPRVGEQPCLVEGDSGGLADPDQSGVSPGEDRSVISCRNSPNRGPWTKCEDPSPNARPGSVGPSVNG